MVACAIAAGGLALGLGAAERHGSAPAPQSTAGSRPPSPRPRIVVRQPGQLSPCSALVPRVAHAVLPVPQWSSPCAQELAQALPAGAR